MDSLPRIGIVGPLLGQNPGWVTSQGEVLAEQLVKQGYTVLKTSSYPGRIQRLVDTVQSLREWENRVDIVILLVFNGPSFILADISSLLVRWMHKPLILWLHAGYLPVFAARYPSWVARVFKRGSALVTPTKYLCRPFAKFGVPVNIIPNILPIENYQFRLRTKLKPQLLWMRTFHDYYYPEMAVQVLQQLIKDYPDATLTMAGQDLGKQKQIFEIINQLNLDHSVSMAGFLDLPGKQKHFPHHDIFLNTNHIDNMPVSVIEAAAFGLPVVSTSVGGIPDMFVDGQTALLVEDGDTNGMTSAVLRLLENPDLAGSLSRNARQLAESCDWSAVKPAWEALIQNVLSTQ